MKEELKMYCMKCKKKTPHSEHGFMFYNRRHRCKICGMEAWDGKDEMDAPLE